MAVAARCAECNKGYRVDEKLAGRTLKCKACGGAVAVPASGAAPVVKPTAAAAPARRPAAAAAAVASKPAAAPATHSGDPFDNMDALLNLEAGGTVLDDGMPALAPPPLPKNPSRRGGGDVPMAAPAYAPPLPPRASTVPQRRPGWTPGGQKQQGGGLASNAVSLAIMIAGGVMALLFVVGLAVDAFKPAAAMIMVGLGALMMLAGGIMCLITAFKESAICGLLYLFVPFYALYFVFSRLEQTKLYLLIYGIGLGSVFAGSHLLPSHPGMD